MRNRSVQGRVPCRFALLPNHGQGTVFRPPASAVRVRCSSCTSFALSNGQDDRLRSCGLRSPGPALFQAEQRPVVSGALLEHAVSSFQGKRIAGLSCALPKWRFREDLNPYHLRS
jgi:hypothetical protein